MSCFCFSVCLLFLQQQKNRKKETAKIVNTATYAGITKRAVAIAADMMTKASRMNHQMKCIGNIALLLVLENLR